MTYTLVLLALVAVGLIAYFRYRRPTRSGDSPPAAGKPGQFPRIRGPGRFATQVVGESHYRASFLELTRRHQPDVDSESFGDAVLTLEENNPHDANAVSVTLEGLPVGHLDRAMAKDFRAALKRDGLTQFRQFACGARLYWGGDEEIFSVSLDLPISNE